MERPCDSDSLLMEKESPLPPRQPAKTTILPPIVPERSRVLDRAIELELINGRHLDPSLDGKTIRRTISNRLSAQRSRMKKTHYLADMERKAQELEKLVSSLTPKVEVYKEKKRMLQLENDSLRAQLHIRQAQSKISQDGVEQRRREIMELKEMLRQKGVEMQPPAAGEIQITPPRDDEIMVQGGLGSGSGSGPRDEEIIRGGHAQEVVEEEVGPKPYSIEFYEQRLMQMEMKQFIEQELKEPELMIEMSLDEEEEEEEEEVEVDQYLNLDDAP